jgi:hypothetical protein
MTKGDDEAMLIARALVEEHSYRWGMVPYPDFLKEAVAKALRTAAKVSEERGRVIAFGEQEQRDKSDG